MLPGLSGGVGRTGIYGPRTFKMIDAITQLGLTANLKLCLDASDAASVASGSQTKWLDVSGGGYDFFLGTDGTSQTSDPTFNGTPGGQSSAEFYSFDGADWFTYDTTAEPWMNALHQAAAIWSFAAWVYLPSVGGGAIFSTAAGVIQNRVSVHSSAGESTSLVVDVDSAASPNVYGFTQVNGAVGSAWNFISASMNVPANTRVSRVNGATEQDTCAYSSPGAGVTPDNMRIGASSALASGSRIACLAVWQGTALTASQLEGVYSRTRSKFVA